MEGIKQKLEILNHKDDNLPSKFMVSLIVSSFDDIQKITALLLEKGIIVLDKEKELVLPKDYKIFTEGYDYIRDMIDKYEAIGELDALKEDVSRITSKTATERILYLKKNDEPYKTPEKKYSNIPFRLSKFRSKYHEEKQDNNIYDEILSQPQETGMDVDAYLKYEILLDHAKQISITLYGSEELDEKIKDNITKLITKDIDDDKNILFYAFTYGKNASEEQKQLIMRIINDELDYTSIHDLDIGRAA